MQEQVQPGNVTNMQQQRVRTTFLQQPGSWDGRGPVVLRCAFATKSSSATTAGPNAIAIADDGTTTTWPDAVAT
jgi:hypothetical protein